MKDHLADLVRAGRTPAHSRNIVREYLQARILGGLQRQGAMIPLAFHGGTALRFLYALPRHSEDLDFALERARSRYDFRSYIFAIRSELMAEGYEIDLKINDKKVVHNGFIRFRGLLYELDLSAHRKEVFTVKVEVDTNPPEGAILNTTVVRRHVTLQLQHHDPSSLLAGKVHAFLQRRYPKGRDLYDLLWYLSNPNWPAPNLRLLNNALHQTGWSGETLTKKNWREILLERIQELDWEGLREDVLPFLENTDEVVLLAQENFLQVLKRTSDHGL